MSIAKVIEILAESNTSFDDAVKDGIRRAGRTVKNIKGAWIRDHEVVIEDDNIVGYRVKMKITFLVGE